MAIFDSPDALTSAVSALASSQPEAVTRAIGTVLIVWSPMARNEDDSQDDGDSQESAAALGVGSALRATGGRYYDSQATPVFECTAPNEDVARRIFDSLEIRHLASMNSVPLDAPWDEPDGPTAAQELSRRTFRIAMTANTGARAPYLSSGLWGLLFPTKGKDVMNRYRAAHVLAVQTALASARAKEPLDEDVARLVVERVGGSTDRDSNDDELSTRLGASGGRKSRVFGFGQDVTREGSRVMIRVMHPFPAEIDGEILPLVPWLCAQACETRVLIETR
jgi:hypothetical protein